MLEFLFILPLLTGVAAFFLPSAVGRGLLIAAGLSHFVLSVTACLGPLLALAPGFFLLTPIGMLVLLVTSFVFMCNSWYAIAYLAEARGVNQPVCLGCLLLFLGTMSMVALADHPIVLWIAIEATTLVSAPLIFLGRSREALEATWKYVLICSVGIALALLGCFFITQSVNRVDIVTALTFSSLNAVAGSLDPLWLKIGFIFVVIGFGTKMGLAPMHTWLPDAHSEAPSPVSALLSGALLNCAMLGVYKVHTLMYLAGLGDFSANILIGLGLLSMLVAGVFIVRQQDYKRMLAYSSIENMGIIVFGIGIGGLALYGAMLHMIHHSLIKSSLFLSAGNILSGFGTKAVDKVGALAKLLPGTFLPFFAGFIGISGLPPFGLFISELFILVGAFETHHPVAALLFIGCLVLAVAGAAPIFAEMSFAGRGGEVRSGGGILRTVPPYVLLFTSVVLSVWMPQSVHETIAATIVVLGGVIHG